MKNNVNVTNRYEEVELHPVSGMAALLFNILAMLACIAVIIVGSISMYNAGEGNVLWIVGIVLAGVYLSLVGPALFGGLRIIKPNEALVLALFGKYIGTIKREGFYFVNPFATAVNPAFGTTTQTLETSPLSSTIAATTGINLSAFKDGKKISLKVSTLSNNQQKINDALGNPINIGIVVIWRVVNTAYAVFNVYNYKEFLSIQCDSALRNIVRLYPYDAYDEQTEKSLRGSSQEIADKLKEEIQQKVAEAGLEIMEARITQLAYAPEIAAAMLQRQQASAIVDARQMIVDGAVGMVEMALTKLSEKNVVHLDEERKAAMVSNLLVVLCGNRDAQPIVNSGSLY